MTWKIRDAGKIIVSTFVVALICLAAEPAVADLVIDQQYDTSVPAPSTLSVYNNNTWGPLYRSAGQTFIPSKDNIAAVELFLYVYSGHPGGQTFTVGIYQTDASHHPTGSALATASKDVSSLPVATADWVMFNFTTAPITAGTEYIIWCTADPKVATGSIAIKSSNNTNLGYPSGLEVARTNDGGDHWYTQNYDMVFKTYAEVVPEPATMGLVVIGLAAVCGRKRLRK